MTAGLDLRRTTDRDGTDTEPAAEIPELRLRTPQLRRWADLQILADWQLHTARDLPFSG